MIAASMMPVTTDKIRLSTGCGWANEASAPRTPRPASTQVTMRAQFFPFFTCKASRTAQDQCNGVAHRPLAVHSAKKQYCELQAAATSVDVEQSEQRPIGDGRQANECRPSERLANGKEVSR